MHMQMQTQTDFALGAYNLSPAAPACLSSSEGNTKECRNAATETATHAQKDG